MAFFHSLAVTLLIAVASTDSDEVKFTYKGSHGPAHWGRLSPSYSACSSGKMQSPINIIEDDAVLNDKLPQLIRYYKPANATLINHGYSIVVQYEGDSGRILDEGTTYNLKQMHWHSPSEHQIDGQQFAAELHLFHESNSDKIAVVGILYQYGDPDPFLTKIKYKLEELAKEGCSNDNEEAHIPLGYLDNKLLRKNTRRYYRYIGSLTTPPCSENVIWIILGKVRTISKEQVEALKAPLQDAYKDNSSPCNPSMEDRLNCTMNLPTKSLSKSLPSLRRRHAFDTGNKLVFGYNFILGIL